MCRDLPYTAKTTTAKDVSGYTAEKRVKIGEKVGQSNYTANW